jgi:hypothetical protein
MERGRFHGSRVSEARSRESRSAQFEHERQTGGLALFAIAQSGTEATRSQTISLSIAIASQLSVQ